MNAKVLILQNEISSYSVPVYNEIAKRYDLTVAFYLRDKSSTECQFKKKKLESYSLGPFIFIKNLRKLVSQFDVVTFLPNLRVPSYIILPFLPRKNKVINWSIGFRASYTNPYEVNRKHVLADDIFKLVLSKSDASIFYMDKAKEFWNGSNLDISKVFVAPNTTDVIKIEFVPKEKKDFLFVGTLYKGKGVDVLLKTYKKAVEEYGVNNQLHIVGDGEERAVMENYVANNHLSGKVIFHGAIYEEGVLAQRFSKALICISPNQAGLSVPKSMGYGVPFVTRKDAITGGEIYHISHGVNGLMYEKDVELADILADASQNPQKYINMGIKAKEYYDNNATICHMAQGAMNAFEYVIKQ